MSSSVLVVEAYSYFRRSAASWRAVERKSPGVAAQSVANALYSKMSVGRARTAGRIESVPVVCDSETQHIAVKSSAYVDSRGSTMSDSVQGKLADDSQYIMHVLLRKPAARRVEAD
jgi:hypothetical protein